MILRRNQKMNNIFVDIYIEGCILVCGILSGIYAAYRQYQIVKKYSENEVFYYFFAIGILV